MVAEPKLIADTTCSKKAQMFAELRAVMTEIVALHNREIDAVVDVDIAQMDSIGTELRQARARKDALMHAYTEHVQDHGC